jgi:hypothetical protein
LEKSAHKGQILDDDDENFYENHTEVEASNLPKKV